MIRYLVIMFFIPTFFTKVSFAQELKEIKIGDTVPDVEIGPILNYHRDKIRLSELRGKLVIFDFWSYWCAPCIAGMPKMDSMQKLLGNKIVVLPVYSFPEVNAEVILKVSQFWKTNAHTNGTDLPTVLDTTIWRLFADNRTVAYQAWIDMDGILRALTDEEYVNPKEISKMLEGKFPDWETAEALKTFSLGFNGKPLNTSSTENEKVYSFFDKYRPKVRGFGSHNTIEVDSSRGTMRMTYVNVPIINLYQNAIQDRLPQNRFLIMTSDSSRFFRNTYQTEWLRQNAFCYEIQVPISMNKDKLYDKMLHNLDSFFHLNTGFQNRWIDCYVLRKVQQKSPDVSTKERFLSDDPCKSCIMNGQQIAEELNRNQLYRLQTKKLPLPKSNYFINEIDENDPVRFFLKDVRIETIATIKKVLLQHGYDIVQEKRNLEVFVIADRPAQNRAVE